MESIRAVIDRTYRQQQDGVYRNYIENRFRDVVSCKRGMDAPDFVLQNESGEQVSLSTFKGKVIYLDFWYAACGPCHALFETLKPLKQHYSNDHVIFLSISIDSKEVWQKALKKFNIEGYHVFTQHKQRNFPVIETYKVAGYPTTCLIDGKGKMVMANPPNNPDELKKEIEQALNAMND